MTQRPALALRIIAAILFLTSAAWSAAYLAGLPFNSTTAGVSVVHAGVWLLIAWLALRNHPGQMAHAMPGWVTAAFLYGAALYAPAVNANDAAVSLQGRLGLSNLQFGLISPTAEELLKFTAVFVLCTMVMRIQRPVEAVTVAIAVGFGFSAVENATYILRGALENLNSDLEGSLVAAGIRCLPAPWAHAFYTGLTAWGLGNFLCRTDKPMRWRVGQLVGWYLFGYAAHAVFNTGTELPGDVAPIIGFFATSIFVFAGGIWFYVRSRKIGRRTLADSAGNEDA